MARGILRSDLVELLRVEQGLEAPLSLCLTSYAWIFSMYSTNFWLLMTLTIPSQLSSIYTVAMFGREIVDFDLDAAESLQLKERDGRVVLLCLDSGSESHTSDLEEASSEDAAAACAFLKVGHAVRQCSHATRQEWALPTQDHAVQMVKTGRGETGFPGTCFH
ncbi:unnamed protein product [Durusdinium trenchii]|uniref:Uncharacterized protein n=1 Tax=Durusdinium trenchii TaxID=1381693 RepID=A0ABP0N435_9DINO